MSKKQKNRKQKDGKEILAKITNWRTSHCYGLAMPEGMEGDENLIMITVGTGLVPVIKDEQINFIPLGGVMDAVTIEIGETVAIVRRSEDPARWYYTEAAKWHSVEHLAKVNEEFANIEEHLKSRGDLIGVNRTNIRVWTNMGMPVLGSDGEPIVSKGGVMIESITLGELELRYPKNGVDDVLAPDAQQYWAEDENRSGSFMTYDTTFFCKSGEEWVEIPDPRDRKIFKTTKINPSPAPLPLLHLVEAETNSVASAA